MDEPETPQPRKPERVHPFAEAFLERLQDRPGAEHFILGGYFALKHYLDYRTTDDVDAWWNGPPDVAAMDDARTAFAEAAATFGLTVSERSSGETVSIEAKNSDNHKVFSFQVASRTVEIERPITSPWGRLPIETVEENVAAKMNALVSRGAPRDFVDVKAVVDAGLVAPERCWQLWETKNPDERVDDARVAVQQRLASIVARTPLERIAPERREAAIALRTWYRDVFAASDRRRTLGERGTEDP